MSDSFVTPWTVVHQAPLFVGFPRQEYWSEFPFPSPGDFPNPGMKSGSPALQADSLPSEPPGKPVNTVLQWVAYPFSEESSDPGIKLGSPALQADSLPAELPGKPTFVSAVQQK